jgi:hypothetical protein
MMMNLSIENTDDLEWAFQHNDGVKEIRFSAVVVRQKGLDIILKSIKNFPDLKKIRIADDYLREKDIILKFENSMKRDYPDIILQWTYDLKIDGKHGR